MLKKIIIINFSLLIVLNPFIFAQETDNNGIEIYIKGERYKSYHDYNLEKLKLSFKKIILLSEGQDLGSVIDLLIKEYNQEQVNEFSIKEYLETFKSVYDEMKSEVDVEEDEDDFAEMQTMLNDFSKKNRKAKSIKIDPKKIKTIVISPSTKDYIHKNKLREPSN